MITNYLFINGIAEVGIDYKNNKYYINDEIINEAGWGVFVEVSLEKFREVLRTTFKWIPESWSKELKEEYSKLLEV